VDSLLWNKLIVNVGLNALTALLRVPNGVVASVPAVRELAAQLVAEAAAVAAARGTPVAGDPLAQVLAVAEATAANRSSMLQDVLRGSPTEIHTINGAVVREGERLGIATPVNRMVLELVQAVEETASMRV
jgi:2-dehydropantoate 2-reductase